MAERGLQLAHTTIPRWVRRYAPEFIKRWNRFGRGSGRSWRVDETYIKVRGRWVSVVFWPPCLGAAEESSSISGGHAATGVLGWRLESRLGEAHLGPGGGGL